MMKPKRVKISAEVEPSVRARFRIWSAQQKRSARQALAKLVEDAVAQVGAPRPAPVDEEPAPPPIDWTEEFYGMLQVGEWLPRALERLDAARLAQGLRTVWMPPELQVWWVEDYRARCIESGRDAEADLAIYKAARERV